MEAASYVEKGVYSISDAARLIDMPQARLRRWVTGDPHGQEVPPLIMSDLRQIGRQVALSFVNLVEALFISRFAAFGVHVRSIRMMAEEAQQFLNTPHPFATDILFKTDGKKIFACVERNNPDDRGLYDLKRHNWAIERVVGPGLKEAVVYGPQKLAHIWYPRRKLAPHVLLNPVAAFGQPVLADSGVPTRALYDAFLAEDKDPAAVASWYDVSLSRVREAVRFERGLLKESLPSRRPH
jgi:uncharacterized protein (DUF433 family)